MDRSRCRGEGWKSKDGEFFYGSADQALLGTASILALGALGLSTRTIKESPLSTFHYALYFLLTLISTHLTWLNHHTSRTSANIILLFWPFYTLVSAVRIRTMILTGKFSPDITNTDIGRMTLARESLWLASAVFGLAEFVLELFSPEKRWKSSWWTSEGRIKLPESDEDEERDQVQGLGLSKNEYGDVESPVVRANIYERLTFSWLTRKSPNNAADSPSIPWDSQIPRRRGHVVTPFRRLCRSPLEPPRQSLGASGKIGQGWQEEKGESKICYCASIRWAIPRRWSTQGGIRHSELSPTSSAQTFAQLRLVLQYRPPHAPDRRFRHRHPHVCYGQYRHGYAPSVFRSMLYYRHASKVWSRHFDLPKVIKT